MRNADMPAMPLSLNPGEFAADGMNVDGLTKREEFAKAAMQGILANQNYTPPRRDRLAGMAKDAVAAADALLAELEEDA